MSTNPSADNISTITELENAISQRARRIVIASNFQAWPDTAEKFYRFLPPDPKGIHACERVWHPGSSRLAGFNDLCDLILGGCEVIIELVPECQQAIRFTEMLLATLNEDVEAQRVASPIGYALVKTTDWSVKDGCGPKTLPVPSVIGFTDSENLKADRINKPAVIWSKHWQLSTDPIDSLLKRVGQIIEQNIQLLKPSKSTQPTTPDMDLWVDQALVELQHWIEDRRNMSAIGLDKLVYDQLPDLPHGAKLGGAQVGYLCRELAQRLHERRIRGQWCAMMRAPATLMFEMSGRSFGHDDTVGKDCWGYPFMFEVVFGSGTVKVCYEGMSAISKPAVGISTESMQAGAPSAVIEKPDDLLSIEEAASYAHVSKRTITTWLSGKTANGTPMLPGVIRTPRLVKIPRRDLDPWRKAKTSTKASSAKPRKSSARKKR